MGLLVFASTLIVECKVLLLQPDKTVVNLQVSTVYPRALLVSRASYTSFCCCFREVCLESSVASGGGSH